MDREAWRATVCGVARTQLKQLSTHTRPLINNASIYVFLHRADLGSDFSHVSLLQSLSYSLSGNICPAHPQPQVNQASISPAVI